jgi:hypothetical protein
MLVSSVAWNVDRSHNSIQLWDLDGSEFADSQSDALRYLDSASIHAFEMKISTAWMYIQYMTVMYTRYILTLKRVLNVPGKRVSCIKVAFTSSVDAPRGIFASSTALRGTCC